MIIMKVMMIMIMIIMMIMVNDYYDDNGNDYYDNNDKHQIARLDNAIYMNDSTKKAQE